MAFFANEKQNRIAQLLIKRISRLSKRESKNARWETNCNFCLLALIPLSAAVIGIGLSWYLVLIAALAAIIWFFQRECMAVRKQCKEQIIRNLANWWPLTDLQTVNVISHMGATIVVLVRRGGTEAVFELAPTTDEMSLFTHAWCLASRTPYTLGTTPFPDKVIIGIVLHRDRVSFSAVIGSDDPQPYELWRQYGSAYKMRNVINGALKEEIAEARKLRRHTTPRKSLLQRVIPDLVVDNGSPLRLLGWLDANGKPI